MAVCPGQHSLKRLVFGSFLPFTSGQTAVNRYGASRNGLQTGSSKPQSRVCIANALLSLKMDSRRYASCVDLSHLLSAALGALTIPWSYLPDRVLSLFLVPSFLPRYLLLILYPSLVKNACPPPALSVSVIQAGVEALEHGATVRSPSSVPLSFKSLPPFASPICFPK